jgi:aspartyl-tRNA(Asn)/glutamyl-tRNA(Gln) amidotransferase subunit B
LRSKEEADDYRYFAEPDLVPLDPTEAAVASIDAELPALPADRRRALAAAAGVEPAAAAMTVERGLDDLAMAAIAAGAAPERVLTHVDNNLAVEGADRLSPEAFARLIAMESEGALTATQAKTVLAEMVATGQAPGAIAEAKGFEAMDTSALEAVLDQIVADNPDAWVDYCEGDDKKRGKLTGFFVGNVMKATKGQADGKVVTALLEQRRVGAG